MDSSHSTIDLLVPNHRKTNLSCWINLGFPVLTLSLIALRSAIRQNNITAVRERRGSRDVRYVYDRSGGPIFQGCNLEIDSGGTPLDTESDGRERPVVSPPGLPRPTAD